MTFPGDWSNLETSLYQNVFQDVDYRSDPIAESMYHHGFFNFDVAEGTVGEIRQDFYDYMMDVYGIDFREDFDWDVWRDAYEGEG